MSQRRRLFFDIETAPNVVYCWQTGYDLKITHECIVEERAVICVCWKWEDQKRVNSLVWDKNHSDEKLLKDFVKIIEVTDEAVGHNGDRFDIPWLRTRCLYHRIPFPPNVISIDTLKHSRSKFKFNSNKLDYIGQFLGLGGKIKVGGWDAWKAVMEDNKAALQRMVQYCKQDVLLLEAIFHEMQPYLPARTHLSGDVRTCPECEAEMDINKVYYTRTGYRRAHLKCPECSTTNTVAASRVES